MLSSHLSSPLTSFVGKPVLWCAADVKRIQHPGTLPNCCRRECLPTSIPSPSLLEMQQVLQKLTMTASKAEHGVGRDIVTSTSYMWHHVLKKRRHTHPHPQNCCIDIGLCLGARKTRFLIEAVIRTVAQILGPNNNNSNNQCVCYQGFRLGLMCDVLYFSKSCSYLGGGICVGVHTRGPQNTGCLLQLLSPLFTEAECLAEPGACLAHSASHLIPKTPWPCPLNAEIAGGFHAHPTSV